MSNQTDFNNRATSHIVNLRRLAVDSSTSEVDTNFYVVDSVNHLSTIPRPKVGYVAIIWNPSDVNMIPSIAYYFGSEWVIKSLRGERGEKGERGSNGVDGRNGERGSKGDAGRNGIDGFTPNHKWEGTQLQFQTPEGGWGVLVDLKGEKGDVGERGSDGAIGKAPEHQWEGTQLRFKEPNGSWGVFTDLRGLKGDKGEQGIKGLDGINGTPPRHELDIEGKRFRFELPEGGWGEWISYESEFTFTGGLVKLDITTSLDNRETSISEIINNHNTEINLEIGTNLFVRIFRSGGVKDNASEKYDKLPMLVEHYWYKHSGVKSLGQGGEQVTDDDFILVYSNNTINESGSILVDKIPLNYSFPYFDGMGFYSLGDKSNATLKDYLFSNERLLRRTLLEGIKFKFSWGGISKVTKSSLLEQGISLGVSDIKGVLNGSYAVTYPTAPNGVLVVRNLKIKIPFYEYIKGLNPVIIVDVYKKRKNKGLDRRNKENQLFKSAGYKTRNVTKETSKGTEFITNIPVTGGTMILDNTNFNVDRLFSVKKTDGSNVDPKFIFKTKGSPKSEPNVTTDGKNTAMCFTRLRFRLQWEERYSDGRIKKYRTVDCGQLGVQIIRLTDAEYENNFLNSQDESSKVRVHSGGTRENIRCSRRLLTYKII